MGACSIGINPTFAGGSHTIEVFLFDFSADLYGQELVIHFVERLRAIERFPDLPSLLEQINADVARARQMLAAGLPTEIRL
jgi:riboflavin kinase/FMN adenylyltransferase